MLRPPPYRRRRCMPGTSVAFAVDADARFLNVDRQFRVRWQCRWYARACLIAQARLPLPDHRTTRGVAGANRPRLRLRAACLSCCTARGAGTAWPADA